MSHITFDRHTETLTFTTHEGKTVKRITEIRFDPLTGQSTRILTDPGAPFVVPDYSDAAVRSAGGNCPFCPENLYRITPDFPATLAPDGKLKRGQITVLPNLFPYAAHNAVVVLGARHYLRLADFSEELLVEGFLAAQDYIKRVQQQARQPLYTAINCNYLPASGGSILHPHLHATLSHTPSNYQRRASMHGKAFKEQTGTCFFDALCAAEEAAGSRWIAELGPVRWLHAFAPKSHNDYIGVLPQHSIDALAPDDWRQLVRGLLALFAALTEQGLASFNLMLTEADGLPLHLRLISRIAYGPLQTSDVNFFEILHEDSLSVKKPEDVAALARGHFPAG